MTLANPRPGPALALGLLIFAAALMLPQVADRGTVFFAGVVAINILFGTAFNFAFSKAGVLSFGHAMFFALGAYLCGWFITKGPEIPFTLILSLAALSGAALAALVAWMAVRRAKGVAFAVITLAVGELLHVMITRLDFLGRNDGMTGVRRPSLGFGPFNVDLATGNGYYYFILCVVLLLTAALWYLWNSAWGRSLHAVRSDEMRSEFLGLPTNSLKIRAFAVSGAFSAVAGALFAPWTQIVSPDIAMWTMSTKPLLFALLGGMSFFFGPLVGAIVFGLLEYCTRSLAGMSEVLVGGMLLAVVLAVPGGLLGAGALLFSRLRGSRSTAGQSKTEVDRA